MTSASPAVRISGFTLVEMLVVLAIMAIAIGGAVLAMRPGEARQLAGEADRLALLFDLAREESRLGGAPLAWVGASDGYVFQRREFGVTGPAWSGLQRDSLLGPRKLPAGIEVVRVEADGRRVPPGGRVDLGPQGVQRVVVELAAGRTRILVTGDDDRFGVVALAEEAL